MLSFWIGLGVGAFLGFVFASMFRISKASENEDADEQLAMVLGEVSRAWEVEVKHCSTE